MKPKAYKLFDLYECYGEIGTFDTLEDALKAAEKWEEDTDGECDLVILRWNNIYSAYKTILVMQDAVWERVS